jgi:hypothetical protein
MARRPSLKEKPRKYQLLLQLKAHVQTGLPSLHLVNQAFTMLEMPLSEIKTKRISLYKCLSAIRPPEIQRALTREVKLELSFTTRKVSLFCPTLNWVCL